MALICGGDMSASRCFTADMRLKTRSEFQACMRPAPLKWMDKHNVFLFRRNSGDTSRLGIVAPKYVMRLAVSRNHFKRVHRECFRSMQHQVAGKWDIVVKPRAAFSHCSADAYMHLVVAAWQGWAAYCRRCVSR